MGKDEEKKDVMENPVETSAISRRGFFKKAEKWSGVVTALVVGAGSAKLITGCYADSGGGGYSDYSAYSAYSDYSNYAVYAEYGAYGDYSDYCNITYCDSACHDYYPSYPVCYCNYSNYADSGCYS